MPKLRKKKKVYSTSVKLPCLLCGADSHYRTSVVRVSPKNPNLLAVMLSSHVLFASYGLEEAKLKFKSCATAGKITCRVHFADAAKQLAMELIALGVPFTSYGDGSARYGMAAFVGKSDIPKQFLDHINEVVKQFGEDLAVTEEDVTKFVNEYLWRYLSRNRNNTTWDAITKLLPGIKRKITEEPPHEQSRSGGKDPVSSSTVSPHPSPLPSNLEIPRIYSSTGGKIRCILCGMISHVQAKTMRMSLEEPHQLAVMLSSHVLFGPFDLEQTQLRFKTCVAVRKMTCNAHFTDAAKQLAAGLIALGVPFLSHGDGSARFGMTAVVEQNDIPKNFLHRINEVVRTFDKDLSVTSEDVAKFINEFLWVYLCRHNTCTVWSEIARLFPGIEMKIPRKDQEYLIDMQTIIGSVPQKRRRVQKPRVIKKAVNSTTVLPPSSSQPSISGICGEEVRSKEAAQHVHSSNDIEHGYGYGNAAYRSCSSLYAEPSRKPFTKVEPSSDSANVAPDSTFDLVRPLPRLATTDPGLLQCYVTVKVEALLSLFQFCPQCGQKLEVDGSVQLMMDGAAPLVHYVCERCSQEEPIVKSWDSRRES